MATWTTNRPSQSTADRMQAQTQCEELKCIRACFFGYRSELASACCRCSAGRLGRPSESARHYILPAARRHRAATHNAPVSRRACGSGSGASDPRPIRVASAAECVAPAPYRRTNPAPGVPGPALRGRFKPTVAPRQSASLGRPRHPPREGREDAEGGSRGGVWRRLRDAPQPARPSGGQAPNGQDQSAGEMPSPPKRRRIFAFAASLPPLAPYRCR